MISAINFSMMKIPLLSSQTQLKMGHLRPAEIVVILNAEKNSIVNKETPSILMSSKLQIIDLILYL
jgi:hypothetical protein